MLFEKASAIVEERILEGQQGNGIDADSKEYLLSYFEDDTNDFSMEGLMDFLQPMLEATLGEHEIEQLCTDLAALRSGSELGENGENGTYGNGTRQLDSSIVMLNHDSKGETAVPQIGQKIGDIRHTMSNRGPEKSLVDQRKLRNAEKKIEEKRKARGMYNGEVIPEWNPSVVPQMVVNQSKKSAGGGDSRSKDIKLDDFDIQFAGKKILLNASLLLANGRRYGLVGKNGIGKSTLLRAIARRELQVPAHIRILHVEQEIAGDDTIALVSVLQADEQRESLLAEEQTLSHKMNSSFISVEESNEISTRLKEVYLKLEEIESDKAESKASAILNGLGFSPAQQQAATKTFSGGWRMRLALARALFCRPDLLLADEVTNYLDFPAVVWLEKYFQSWTATLLVVSHDRSFLESVSTDILHMHNNQLDTYRGTFANFVSTREERRKNIIREYEAQKQYRAHLQDFIDRWRYNANRAALAQSKIKILEKLPPLVEPSKDDMEGMGEGQDSIYFKFPVPEKLSPPILQMDDVTFGYDKSRMILSKVSFDLQMDSKIAVVGPNGAGKSTLIYLLTGQHSPISGICHRHGRLRLGLFSQHHVDQLELGLSSAAFLAKQFPGMVEEEYRRILGRFGLTGMTAMQPIGTLSGGQKSRTVFAWISMMNPHVLVLDEPTNHLDMDSIEALAQALREFKGGVVIVSHDQQFLDSVCNEVWICQNGSMKKYQGTEGNQRGIVYQYKASLLKDDM